MTYLYTMPKKYLTVLLLAIMAMGLNAQDKSSLPWIAKHDGKDPVFISNLKVDPNGNALVSTGVNKRSNGYLAGKNATLTVPKTQGEPLAYPNLILTQYNSQGAINWSLTIASKNAIYTHTIEIDAENNYYIGGSFKDDADFIGTGGKRIYIPLQMAADYQKSLYRFFLAKYTNSGQLLWVKTGVAWDNMFCKKIVPDGKGNVYAWVYTPARHVVVEDYIFQPFDGGHALSRNEFILIKINATGQIDWITRTGDEVHPSDFRLNEKGDIEIRATVSTPWYVFKYIDGTEKVIDERANKQKHLYSEGYIISAKNGKLINRTNGINETSNNIYGHVVQTKAIDKGSINWLSTKSTNEDKVRRLKISGRAFRVKRNGQEWINAIYKVDAQNKVQWSVVLHADMKGIIHDVLPMADNMLYMPVTIQGVSTFYQSNGDSICYPYCQNINYTYLMRMSGDGIIDTTFRIRIGSYSSRHQTERVAIQSHNGKDMYLMSNINYPEKYIGVEFDKEYRDKNYPRYGCYNMGYLCLNPMLKKPIEVFDLDSIKRPDYVQTLDVDSLPDSNAFTALKPKPFIGTQTYNTDIDTSSNQFTVPNEPRVMQEVFLYPNPVSADNPNFYIQFDANANEQVRIMVFNADGKQVYDRDFISAEGRNQVQIELPSTLSNGLYLVNITVGKRTVVKRLVIS